MTKVGMMMEVMMVREMKKKAGEMVEGPLRVVGVGVRWGGGQGSTATAAVTAAASRR
jgi:hypothetical protein